MTDDTILGWKITTYTVLPGLGRVKDKSFEYGNSPVRDHKARKAFEKELADKGVDFETVPIRGTFSYQNVPMPLRMDDVRALSWLCNQKEGWPISDHTASGFCDRVRSLLPVEIQGERLVEIRKDAVGRDAYFATDSAWKAIGREKPENTSPSPCM